MTGLSKQHNAVCFLTPYQGGQSAAGPDWLHEIKYNGYRMMVIREQDRVQLISRGGHCGCVASSLRYSALA
jgi:bifunctional non-homologous end joining protein LigD